MPCEVLPVRKLTISLDRTRGNYDSSTRPPCASWRDTPRSFGERADGRENAVRARGLRFLASAFETLTDFQSRYRGEMSKLQFFLIDCILERTQDLINRLEVEGMADDEL